MSLLLLISIFGILTWLGGVLVNEIWHAFDDGNKKRALGFFLVTLFVAGVAWGGVLGLFILPLI